MKRLSTSVLCALLATSLLGAAPTKSSGNGRLSPDLRAARDGGAGGPVKVVVSVNRGQAKSVASDVTKFGGVVLATYKTLDEMTLVVPMALLDSLTGVSGVDYIAPDRPVVGAESHLQVTTGASLVQPQPPTTLTGQHVKRSDADPAPPFNDVAGLGITIGVIDSGIDLDHFDLRDGGLRRVVARVDFTGEAATGDPFGHGTHVAGIIAGDGSSYSDAGRDFAGIAPASSLVDLRALDGKGRGTLSGVIAAIDWAIANRSTFNLRILNLSLAAPPVDSYLDDPLCRAVQRAESAGIVVVAAAGNFGSDSEGHRFYGGIASPGISPSAITVGAVDTRGTDTRSDDAIAPWSSRGPTWAQGVDPVTGAVVHDGLPKPDLVAPGTRIVSLERPGNLIVATYPELHVETSGRGPYMILSGTSMAAPVVSGAAALILQAYPFLTPKQVKALLMYSAEVLEGADLFEQGAGLLNIDGAVLLARALRDSEPLLAFEDTPSAGPAQLLPQSVIAGERAVWSQGLIWGRGLAFGPASLDSDEAAYAQGLIWGSRRDVWSADVLFIEGTFSDDRVAVGQGDAWKSLLDGPAATYQADLMPDAFFRLDASGLIWGYSRWFLGDSGLIWGLRRFDW